MIGHARLHSTSSSNALLHRCFTDCAHRQYFDALVPIINFLPRQSTIDYIHHIVNSKRRFCNVRADDTFACVRWRFDEHFIAVFRSQCSVQRQDVERVSVIIGRLSLADLRDDGINFRRTSQKHQNVTIGYKLSVLVTSDCIAMQFFNQLNSVYNVIFGRLMQPMVLHRIRRARNTNHWRLLKVCSESCLIQCGTHDNDAQIWSLLHHAFEEAHQQVGIHCALMRLIDDHNFILAQVIAAHGFAQQHTFSHKLEFGVGSNFPVQTYVIAASLANVFALLLRYALGYRLCGHCTRLSTHHATLGSDFMPLQQILRNLGGLTTARLAYNQCDLVLLHCFDNQILLLKDWQ
mmetsp:Transcript_17899/g.28268  ORF Transcript_17899/g.28268 Transcript_17899/m.28268 type:complete len:348 (+) Transcript_17899:1440-2483(+)